MESDDTLLLNPYSASKNKYGSNKWRATAVRRPVTVELHMPAVSSTDTPLPPLSPKDVFSDTEANDVVVTKYKVLNISDLEYVSQIKDYNKVTIASERASLGKDMRIFNHKDGEVRLSFDPQLTHFNLEFDGRVVTKVMATDLRRMIHSKTALLILLKNPLRYDGLTFHSILFSMSASNLVKFLEILDRYLEVNIRIDEKSNDDLHSVLKNSSEAISKFMKPFKSLDKLNPRTSLSQKSSNAKKDLGKPIRLESISSSPAISTISTAPKTSTKVTSETVTPTKAFYSPVVPTPLVPRRLRSSGKTTDTIEIDAEDPLTPAPRRRPRRERKPFKPDLQYLFSDQSKFRISDADFKCLYGSQWINDTLIDFFLKYFTQEETKRSTLSLEDFRVFSTFFFTKLTSSPNYYHNIQSWLSKDDILKKRFLIIPINESLHWYCSIVYNIDSLTKDEGDCTVYCFDSLAQQHDSILEPIRNFILGYAKDKHKLEIDPERIKLMNSQVPKQPNFNDCGIHVIYNVYKFLQDQQKCVSFWDSRITKRGEMYKVFLSRERDEWRARLREILLTLQKEMIEREGYIPEHEEAKEDEDIDEDDIVFLEPEEFQKPREHSEETGLEGERENDAKLEECDEEGQNDDKDVDPGTSSINKNTTDDRSEMMEEDGFQEMSENTNYEDVNPTGAETPDKDSQMEIDDIDKPEQYLNMRAESDHSIDQIESQHSNNRGKGSFSISSDGPVQKQIADDGNGLKGTDSRSISSFEEVEETSPAKNGDTTVTMSSTRRFHDKNKNTPLKKTRPRKFAKSVSRPPHKKNSSSLAQNLIPSKRGYLNAEEAGTEHALVHSSKVEEVKDDEPDVDIEMLDNTFGPESQPPNTSAGLTSSYPHSIVLDDDY